ncbi:MAG: LamG domain-containing protein [Candidatus Hodarchaeota archaeon]
MKRESILVLAMVVLVVNGSVRADLSDGLVAYYPFSGNANDASGNGHDGTVFGATLTTDRLGNPNSAFNFDGIDDYINVAYSPDFQLSTFTIAAWNNPSIDLSPKTSGIVSRGEDFISDQAAFILGVAEASSPWANGAYLYYEDNGDDDFHFGTDYYPPVGSWTHLAATRLSNGQVNIYVNGNLLSHWHSTPEPTTQCFQDLVIGAFWSSPTLYDQELKAFFPGAIDEVRIYNRALSAEEIAELASDPVPSLSGWVWMESGGDFGYSLDENDLLYFLSFGPVWYYNTATSLWSDEGPVGWTYVNWPYLYESATSIMMFALPPESGLWVYHFRPGEWTVSSRTLP